MGDRANRLAETKTARRWAIDIAFLALAGLSMAFLGPFDSDRAPARLRFAYWMLCMVGCGLIAIAADEILRRRLPATWSRVAAVSVIATLPASLFVLATQHLLVGQRFGWSFYLGLLWQVAPILLVVMTIRTLVWRRAPVRVETRTVVAPPLPEAEAAFRRRLSARRRTARLIAIEADDHYLKVHTDAGTELITLRFADALEELALAHGWRVHRSWWVAANAVEEVRWRRGAGEVRLASGLTAPVSRTYGPVLRDAGWF